LPAICDDKPDSRVDLRFSSLKIVESFGAGVGENGSKHDLVNLDFMRAVAVSLVFIGHLLGTMRFRAFGAVGHLGVLLFFVHTSLVLMMSMSRLELRGASLFASFLLRRVFRIYPLSILAIGLVLTLRIPSTSWSGGFTWLGWKDVLSNIVLAQNITDSNSVICVLWSLPYEIQMYVLLPALFLLLLRFRSGLAAFLIWSSGVAVATVEYIARNGGHDPEFLFARYFPCFLAGVVAWRMIGKRESRLPAAHWILFLGALIILYRATDAFRVYGPALLSALHGGLRGDHGVWWPPFMDLVNDWVFCGIVASALPHFRSIRLGWLKVLSKQIAQYSYSVYICHVPVLWFCFKKCQFGSLVVSSICSLALIALTSFALYRWIEEPAIQLGKRLTSGRLHPALA
jgi:peptidoglycan/LPS O-acetylase OafA/YrhL